MAIRSIATRPDMRRYPSGMTRYRRSPSLGEWKGNARRVAFSLVEVMVTTTVMAMMMVALLSYVQFSSQLWKRGEQKMSLYAIYNGILDLLNREMSSALKITGPAVNGTSNYVQYETLIGKGPITGTATFCIEYQPTTRTLRKTLVSTVGSLSAYLVTDPNLEGPLNLLRSRFEYTFARNVATFTVTRRSPVTIAVQVGMQSVDFGATPEEAVILCATSTFLVPAARW